MEQEKHQYQCAWGDEFTCCECGEPITSELHVRIPRQSFTEFLASLAHVTRDDLRRSERHDC